MDWLDHDRLGFNYRLSDIACALGVAQLQRLDELLAGRERVAGLLPRGAAPRSPEVTPPCHDHDGARRGWFVYVIQLPRGVDRDDTVRALARRGVPAKPYFPAIHLMTFYRERFGHRPKASSRSARTCPPARSRCRSFPAMTEGQVAQVAEALTAVLRS